MFLTTPEKKKKGEKVAMWSDECVYLIVMITSQWIHISKHYVIPFKYIQFLFVYYISKKQGKGQNLDYKNIVMLPNEGKKN